MQASASEVNCAFPVSRDTNMPSGDKQELHLPYKKGYLKLSELSKLPNFPLYSILRGSYLFFVYLINVYLQINVKQRVSLCPP